MTFNNVVNSLGALGLIPFGFGIFLTLIEADFLGIDGVDIFTSYSLGRKYFLRPPTSLLFMLAITSGCCSLLVLGGCSRLYQG